MRTKILILPLITTWLSGCYTKNNLYNSSTTRMMTSYEINHDYNEIIDMRVYWENIFDIKDVCYFVYFYSRTCSHCNELKNWIIEQSIINKDIYFCEASSSDVISKIVPQNNINSVQKLSILGYPTLINIEDGILTFNESGVSNIKNSYERIHRV